METEKHLRISFEVVAVLLNGILKLAEAISVREAGGGAKTAKSKKQTTLFSVAVCNKLLPHIFLIRSEIETL